jgi:hypothetical protein
LSEEGFYDPVSNPAGYARYSDLRPDQSLEQVYFEIVIHHEGDSQTYDVSKIQLKHLWKERWTDIGYHYVIGRDGTVYEGRNIAVRGAHVSDANTGRVGVLLLGDFQPGREIKIGGLRFYFKDHDDIGPTPRQVDSALALTRWLDQQYGINSVVGHRAVPYNDTVCPGEYAMPYVSIFNLVVQEDQNR